MTKEHDEEYAMENISSLGTVKIADEVVVIIAGLAATEVKGVTSLAGNITNDLVSKLGMKNLSKGVRIEVSPEDVKVDLAISIAYGYNIPEISKAVQDKVKNAIETMTGLHVSEVNIRIADVNFDNDK
ncbi:MAG: Asp23/Gls24 family envelope stress response protein [Clostridiales bacterium]|nr:Asp23/Gls24 family envelope stress response protein [Clostridiales bacterium]MDY3745289.1 Asp23/Gls24 family envelope stress response protein [Lachnospiraceae bacterium]